MNPIVAYSITSDQREEIDIQLYTRLRRCREKASDKTAEDKEEAESEEQDMDEEADAVDVE